MAPKRVPLGLRVELIMIHQNFTTVNYMVIKKSLSMLNLLKTQFQQMLSTKYIVNPAR